MPSPNLSSTCVYKHSLEVRSKNLLLNLHTIYFFLCLFLLQLERNNFNLNSGLQWAIQIFKFFHLGGYLAQRIGIGSMSNYHKSEKGCKIYILQITTTNSEKNNLLVFWASECQVKT
jgi:hypothetical protein